jgi:hypothetical protein
LSFIVVSLLEGHNSKQGIMFRHLSRSLTPGPLPFGSMKMIPAASKAARIAKSVTSRGDLAPRSKSTIVLNATRDVSARDSRDQSNSALPARHWAAVITQRSLLHFLCWLNASFRAEEIRDHAGLLALAAEGMIADNDGPLSGWDF